MIRSLDACARRVALWRTPWPGAAHVSVAPRRRREAKRVVFAMFLLAFESILQHFNVF